MEKKLIILKIIGVLLVLCGIAIMTYFMVNVVDMISFTMDKAKNAQPAGNVAQALIIGFIFLFIPAVFLLILGWVAITYKKEKDIVIENPNNPLICHNCGRDYDRTWKICLKCGKPLVEKLPP